MRPQRQPRGGAWKGPQIPKHLLHPFLRIEIQKEYRPDKGGIYETVGRAAVGFLGAIFPLSNEDLKRLPEGTSTTNSLCWMKPMERTMTVCLPRIIPI